jgi:hypothetical protein
VQFNRAICRCTSNEIQGLARPLFDGFVGVLRLFSTGGFRKYELESHKGFRLVRSAQRLIVIHPMDGVFLREAGESE